MSEMPDTNIGDRGDSDLVLTGLDGANPLAFLAALGTLRIATRAWPDRRVRLGWTIAEGGWRPLLRVEPGVTREELVEVITAGIPSEEELFDTELRKRSEEAGPKNKRGESRWADKLRFPPEVFRERALVRARQAMIDARDAVDYLAALASDAAVDEVAGHEAARRTRFDFTAGQQSYIEMARSLLALASEGSIENALFGPWDYLTGVFSLRWDPLDESRQYALQAVDPTNASGNPILSVPGANILGLIGLVYFPLIPRGRVVEQPGFDWSRGGRSFRWPIWSPPLGEAAVAALLSLEELRHDPIPRDDVRERGVEVVYRSWIVQPSGRYRNFTPAEAV